MGLAAAASVGAAVVYLSHPGEEGSWLPPCVFHELTGLYCFGCGNTRALHALLHGDLLLSLHDNLLLIPFSLMLGIFAVWPKTMAHYWVTRSVLWILLVFVVLRNLPWFPFTLLAPVS